MIRNFMHKSQGFTLIDLAIAMVVLGLLLVPMAKIMDRQIMEERHANTISNSSAIQIALDQYYFENDSYPCPAILTLNAANNTYGDPSELPIPVPPAPPIAGSPCAGAVIMPNGIMVGGVPFKALKLPRDMTLDGWGNKLTYAVTAELTRTDVAFDQNGGVMTLRQNPQSPGAECLETPANPPVDIQTAAHWVLISHGNEGIGAYNADGILVQACPAGAAATLESENCDYATDTIFFSEICARSDKSDPTYFDDLLIAKDQVPTRIWSADPNNEDDLISKIDSIGINNENPQMPIDVSGNILAESDPTDPDREGLVKTEELCDTNDGDCFDPELIGGDVPAMKCTSADITAMSGISDSRAECGVTFDIITGSCPNGSFMSGIQADGSPLCTP